MSIDQKYCWEQFDAQGRLVHIDLDCPDDFNFGYDVVDAIAETEPDRRAIVWCNTGGEERVFSFGDLRDLSSRAANVFSGAGIARGDRVMAVLKRHWEYWVTAIALHKIGAVLIPATHMLTPDDFAYRIRMAGAKAIVCTPQDDVPEKIRAALMQTGTECLLWTVPASW